MSKKKCPICGAEMKIDTSAVCTSIPPKYCCVCPSCNCLDFIEISEYYQYKEEPSLPSDLDEAAEISDLEAKNLADDYTKFLAAGLTKNEPRPIGPQWMKILASDRFKAGAEWRKEQMMKDAVEGYITLTLAGVRTVAATIKEEDNIGFDDKVRIIIVKEEDKDGEKEK